MAVPDIVFNRKILGASAVLLPMDDHGHIHWNDFHSQLARTIEAGLTPAVNMDTGYVHLLSESQQDQILQLAAQATRDNETGFIAGSFVGDQPGAAFDLDAYRRRIDAIENFGGTPIIFPSFGLNAVEDRTDDHRIVGRYQQIANACSQFYAFELGTMFAPFGRIFSLETFTGLLQIPQCIGLKHSSLRRDWEWQRLAIRDQHRPDFRILTGNDLAIDMIKYGSDYLLGLSTMAPDLFARRDAMWFSGDSDFYALNDCLQYLGCFAFRHPVPAYRHSAAQFLKLRAWISTANVFPGSPLRPTADVAVLQEIWQDLERYM